MFLILLSALLVLLWREQLKCNCRFIPFNTCINTLSKVSNRRNSYSNLLLLCLIQTYFIVFYFYFIILLPSEIIGIQFLNKGKMALVFRCVRSLQCCMLNIFFCVFTRATYFFKIIFTCLRFYPYEMLALWYFILHMMLSSDIHPNPGPTHSDNNFCGAFFTFCNWNLNILVKDNFYRASLLEAYDIIMT